MIGTALVGAACADPASEDIPDDNVVGGTAAEIGDHPWLVSMQLNGEHNCGGVLIDRTRVLTAAHCVVDSGKQVVLGPDQLTVIAGRTNLDESGGQEAAVEKVTFATAYNPSRLTWDYAYLDLAAPVTQEAAPTLVGLPSVLLQTVLWDEGDPVTVAGWGCVGTTGCERYEDSLRSTDLTIASPATCQEDEDPFVSGYDPSVQLCLATLTDSSGCYGDSGGPFVAAVDGSHYLVGLVSGGVTNCPPGRPNIAASAKNVLTAAGALRMDPGFWASCSDQTCPWPPEGLGRTPGR